MVRKRMQAGKSALPVALAVLVLAAGCGPSGASSGGPGTPGQAVPPSADAEQGYVAPPELLAVARSSGGRLELSGRASPGARVRLATPGGAALFVLADAQGAWRLITPPFTSPELLGLSMSDQGRLVQAQGYIFLAPDGVAARLRAGGGAQLVGPLSQALDVRALDYDTVLAATLSGETAANQAVTLRVDGVDRGQSTAGRDGRFVLSVSQPLTPGPRDFDLFAQGSDVQLAAAITPPAPLSGTPFRAERTATGWRVDWLTPGGGEQTTLLFDPGAGKASSGAP